MVYGLGESLEKQTNPFVTMAQNAVSNGILGGTMSGVSANIAKCVQENQLRNMPDLIDMTGKEAKNLQKMQGHIMKIL